MRARVLLAIAACAAVLLAGVVPAGAHDESEVEVGPLEVAASPAIARAGNPVHIKAEYDTDDDEDSDDEDCDDEVTAQAKTDEADEDCDDASDDDASDDDASDDDASDDDASDDDASDDNELVAASVDDDDESDEDESDADESDEDEAEDVEADEDEACDVEVVAQSTRRGGNDCDADETAAMSVTFTVDFGDGSEPAEMTIDGERRGSDKVKAKASHAYDADGDYEVTVTATPDAGEPVDATVVVSVGSGSARLEGDDRIATALRISRDSFADGSAGAVLLARYDGFADALASATLALAQQAPVLLVPTGDIPDEVLAEIERVLGGTGRVYLLGGEAAIAPEAVTQLEGLGHEVVRVAGDDRVATSVAIAQFLIDSGAEIGEVVLASAVSFPDALSGAAYAAEKGAPILLTAPDALSPAVADLLAVLGADTAVTVVGGTAGVSDAVVTELVGLGFTVERLAGDDRYDTAVEIAEAGHPDPTVIVIATGKTFPDALAGGAYAGRMGAPLLLVGDDLPDDLAEYLSEHAGTIKVLVVLGGGGAVPQPVMDDIEAALGL